MHMRVHICIRCTCTCTLLRCAGRFYDERGALSDGWTEAEACEFERRMVEQVRLLVIGAGT